MTPKSPYAASKAAAREANGKAVLRYLASRPEGASMADLVDSLSARIGTASLVRSTVAWMLRRALLTYEPGPHQGPGVYRAAPQEQPEAHP